MEELPEDARQRYLERLAGRTLEQRLASTVSTIQLARKAMEAGIRLRHPGAPPREIQARVAAILCGPSVARRLYGLDVTAD